MEQGHRLTESLKEKEKAMPQSQHNEKSTSGPVDSDDVQTNIRPIVDPTESTTVMKEEEEEEEEEKQQQQHNDNSKLPSTAIAVPVTAKRTVSSSIEPSEIEGQPEPEPEQGQAQAQAQEEDKVKLEIKQQVPSNNNNHNNNTTAMNKNELHKETILTTTATTNKPTIQATNEQPISEPAIAHALAMNMTMTTNMTIPESEIRRLTQAACSRKRYRFEFFNSPDGQSLRLQCAMHFPRATGRSNWCGLCGSFKAGWRGHKTSVRCLLCHVHLCISIHNEDEENVSCWDLWHSNVVIQPRILKQPSAVVVVDRGGAGAGAGAGDVNILNNIQNQSKRPSSTRRTNVSSHHKRRKNLPQSPPPPPPSSQSVGVEQSEGEQHNMTEVNAGHHHEQVGENANENQDVHLEENVGEWNDNERAAPDENTADGSSTLACSLGQNDKDSNPSVLIAKSVGSVN